jgi:wobble nucleotide-excising tRNase
MIESITISDVASYTTPRLLDGFSQFNFIFGSNGTGKTTLGRIIADESRFATCSVKWQGGTKLQTLAYNQDFVERNFNQSSDLKGVFTLGEKQNDIQTKIATKKVEVDEISRDMKKLNQSLHGEDGNGGKSGELTTLENGLKEKCWAKKQKHDAKLQGGFEGFRNNAEKFKNKVLSELLSNVATLLSLAELEKKAENIFGPRPTAETTISVVDTTKLLLHESNPILKKQVIGKEDVDIAAMIKKLGNSDWVQDGREFHRINDELCPFCQQKTTTAFARSLSEYFDDLFTTDCTAIDNLATNYAIDASTIQQQVDNILEVASKFLDVEKLKIEKDLLDTKITLNNQRLAKKKKEASQVVELDSLSDVCTAIRNLVQDANSKIAVHNKIVANLTIERATLTSQIWRFIVDELETDLVSYKTSKDGLEAAMENLRLKISAAKRDKETTEREIYELEKQITSIQPTIEGINRLLSSFGFEGFKLAKAESGHSYKLIRSDGSDAKATLSEGEKTFVTFLYFYHMLKGSESETGITTDRIVVFDDPVSSLDSDILFIVGSLIKGLFDEVRAETGHIKQIFVLTHNVYFHKEVTYNQNRKDVAMNEESFWIVRKTGQSSRVDKHTTNPIKTSYELLWSEIRKPDRSNLAIQNTVRRILENYFKILGGINFDDLCDKFDGKQKVICKSLCSWIHDGSHYAHDDLYVSIEDSMVDTYLLVFRAIFDKMGHIAHYKMMMGDAYVEETADVTSLVAITESTPSSTA